jgi:hypothetical protein
MNDFERQLRHQRAEDPATIVAALYQFADVLKTADKALNILPLKHDRASALDALLDERFSIGDLADAANKVEAIADEWQEALDEAQAVVYGAQAEAVRP